MLNSVIIQGNLTKTPVLATGKSGKRYTKFRIACNQRYGTEQEVDYINCTAFESTAEFITKYFVEGSQILVEGKIHNNDFTDDKGIKHYSYDVTVSSVNFCGSKNSNPQPVSIQVTGNIPTANSPSDNSVSTPFTIVAEASTPPSEGRITF